jgi:hypothetical protein
MAAGNLHAGLVGFNRNQRLFGLDGIARFDEQLDDLDFFEVANVRYFDFYLTHAVAPLFLFL